MNSTEVFLVLSRYDKLLPTFRRPGKQPFHPGVCVVGVSVMEEAVMSAVLSAYQQGSVSLLVCELNGFCRIISLNIFSTCLTCIPTTVSGD